jgi:predicted unusual protein kinase regulating ubiquinone biosynthesis (AarF/ABC1/UbiB family)
VLFRERRFWSIVSVLLRFLLLALKDRLFASERDNQSLRRLRARRVRQLLVELGPTFIKVGQFLSMRRDALPLEIADELSLLQDRLPPLSSAEVRSTIKLELGAEPEQLFSEFDEVPIASASIGQVHRVLLKDGRAAIVKVQRPGLSQLFYQDLGYMRLLSRIGGSLGWCQTQYWLALSDEFGAKLFAEIDYLKEGRHADRMRVVLRSYPQVIIPRVYWKFTGRRVITLEYVPGVKVDSIDELKVLGVNLKAVANLLVECYLEQVVASGFFHADPHAGNLAVDARGNLIIYDFGMMSELSAGEKTALSACVMAICRKDINALTLGLVDLGVIRNAQFADQFGRALKPLLDYYYGADILALDFKAVESEVEALVAGNAFCLPPALAYLLRTGSSLEGLARTLKPNFSFAQAAAPFVRRMAVEQGLINLQRAVEAFAISAIAEMPI